MKLLPRLIPHPRHWSEPIFLTEARRVRWGVSPERMRRSTRRWLGFVVAAVFGTWVILALLGGEYADRENFEAYSQSFAIGLLFLSFGFSVLLDYHSMGVSVRSINGEISARRIDLLRVTPLREMQIIAAKYAGAQVRAWRRTALIMGLRAAAVVVALVGSLVTRAGERLYPFSAREWFFLIYGHVFLAAVALVFIIEPLWRMRAVTALGLAVSSHATSAIGIVLSSALSVFAFWLAQSILGVVLVAMIGFILIPFVVESLVVIMLPLVLALVAASIYGFYSLVQVTSLRHAAWRLATMDSR